MNCSSTTLSDLLDSAFPSQQLSAARVPELLIHHEGLANLAQV